MIVLFSCATAWRYWTLLKKKHSSLPCCACQYFLVDISVWFCNCWFLSVEMSPVCNQTQQTSLLICYLCVSDPVPPWLSRQARASRSNRNHDSHQRSSGQVSSGLLFIWPAITFQWATGGGKWKSVLWTFSVSTLCHRYNAVWIIFFIMGLATLLPWNFFMTATMVSFPVWGCSG